MKTTSLLAYKQKKTSIEKDHSRIMGVLDFQDGMTYKEISKKLGWIDPVKAARRMKELINLGKVDIKTTRTCTIGKRKCSSYIKLV